MLTRSEVVVQAFVEAVREVLLRLTPFPLRPRLF